MQLYPLVLLCALAAVCALLVCIFRTPIAQTMALFDEPDNDRKRHRIPTPLVGGLALFPAIAIANIEAVSQGANDEAIAVLYGIVFGFFMIGYADDRVQIRPSRRLLMTLALFAVLVLTAPGFATPVFQFGGVSLTLSEGAVSLLAIVGATGALNAVNMTDGQDGICSGIFLVWLAFLAVTLKAPYAAAALVAMAGLLVVIAFNLRSVLFLGDLGSYGIGAFVLALMLAGVADHSIDHGKIVALLTVPVVDCVWLMIERTRRGHSPYDPDRQHLHHILDKSFGQWASLTIYLGVVGLGSAAALFGGWTCVLAIVFQTAFVALVRLYGPRVPEENLLPGAVLLETPKLSLTEPPKQAHLPKSG